MIKMASSFSTATATATCSLQASVWLVSMCADGAEWEVDEVGQWLEWLRVIHG